MKNNVKKILKNRIFIFTLGLFIASSVSVLAVTYFPSNDVIYDNTESGLSSTNVQGAIDELYETCKTPSTGGSLILERVPVVSSGDGLYADEYENGRFFYKGANPNNYITFNNEQSGWRIISIEPDKTIKIMKDKIIDSLLAWNSGTAPGVNAWDLPATLNTYLNRTYYNNLISTARNQIVSNNFSIGFADYSYDMNTQVNSENSNKWYGKVALPTLSEYIRTNSDKNNCGILYSYNVNYRSCVNTGWMDTISVEYWWLLTPEYGSSSDVFYVMSNGGNATNWASNGAGAFGVRPVVYLSSEVRIISGDGSQNNPYQLG